MQTPRFNPTPERSRNMAAIRSRNNLTTERRMLALFRDAQITGWRRHLSLPGHPDFTFPKQRLAVFVDGCFWHGCPRCYHQPRTNASYWAEKRANNRRRDRLNTRTLRALGWTVLRIWEHRLANPTSGARVIRRIRSALNPPGLPTPPP